MSVIKLKRQLTLDKSQIQLENNSETSTELVPSLKTTITTNGSITRPSEITITTTSNSDLEFSSTTSSFDVEQLIEVQTIPIEDKKTIQPIDENYDEIKLFDKTTESTQQSVNFMDITSALTIPPPHSTILPQDSILGDTFNPLELIPAQSEVTVKSDHLTQQANHPILNTFLKESIPFAQPCTMLQIIQRICCKSCQSIYAIQPISYPQTVKCLLQPQYSMDPEIEQLIQIAQTYPNYDETRLGHQLICK